MMLADGADPLNPISGNSPDYSSMNWPEISQPPVNTGFAPWGGGGYGDGLDSSAQYQTPSDSHSSSPSATTYAIGDYQLPDPADSTYDFFAPIIPKQEPPTPRPSPGCPPFNGHLQMQQPRELINPDGSIPNDILLDLVDTFFDRTYICFPNMPLQETTFKAGLDTQPRWLLQIICAAAAPLSSDPVIIQYAQYHQIPMYRVGEVFLAKARAIVHELLETETVETAVALYLMALCSFGCGKTTAGFGFLGMAVRMALSCRCDVDPDDESLPPMSWLQKEQRRRLWMCLWIAETCDSEAVGRPSLLAHKKSAVMVPASETLWRSVKTLDGMPTIEGPISKIPYSLVGFRLIDLVIKAVKSVGTMLTLN
ncbi:hypothetical protein HK104_002550, partial [Borealophlyctis nickersoniae]